MNGRRVAGFAKEAGGQGWTTCGGSGAIPRDAALRSWTPQRRAASCSVKLGGAGPFDESARWTPPLDPPVPYF